LVREPSCLLGVRPRKRVQGCEVFAEGAELARPDAFVVLLVAVEGHGARGDEEEIGADFAQARFHVHPHQRWQALPEVLKSQRPSVFART